MSNLYPNLDTEAINKDSNTANMTERISNSEPLKLLTPLKSDKRNCLFL
jgi:hypothetical protein